MFKFVDHLNRATFFGYLHRFFNFESCLVEVVNVWRAIRNNEVCANMSHAPAFLDLGWNSHLFYNQKVEVEPKSLSLSVCKHKYLISFFDISESFTKVDRVDCHWLNCLNRVCVHIKHIEMRVAVAARRHQQVCFIQKFKTFNEPGLCNW